MCNDLLIMMDKWHPSVTQGYDLFTDRLKSNQRSHPLVYNPTTHLNADHFWFHIVSLGLLFSVLLPICREKMVTGLPAA